MNGQTDGFDYEMLERLVDGELPEAEYRRLLQALESHPDGWRRCALAFLESQAWGREAQVVRAEISVPRVEPVPSRRGPSWLYLGMMALACSASFLLAFGLAMRWQNGIVDRSTPQLVTDKQPVPDSNLQFASNTKGEADSAAGMQYSPVGRYRVLVDGDSAQPKAVEMPVFSADDPRARMLLDEYATQPHELIRELESGGNQVQRHRNWVTMPGNSGGPVYVPVDELQVTPVSNRSFQ